MAVYTTLTRTQIEAFLHRYSLGELQGFCGAADGVENTTYFLELDTAEEYVLTVFEMFSAGELPFYIDLTTQLYQQQLPVPCPLVDKQGQALQELAGKPALLFPKISGAHIQQPGVADCRKIGDVLGAIHCGTKNLTEHANPRGLVWMQATSKFVDELLNTDEKQLLQEQLMLREKLAQQSLPTGIIHGDLFRDNVLFHENEVAAVIDFYNAGSDILLLDLAMTVNDWCVDQGNTDAPLLIGERCDALMDAYRQHRAITEQELQYWNTCLQVAACRFWLSRLKSVLLSQQGQQQALKDPDEYKKLLLLHYENTHK